MFGPSGLSTRPFGPRCPSPPLSYNSLKKALHGSGKNVEKKSLRILLLVYVIYVQYLFWYLCFAYWTEDWPKAQGDLTPPRRGKTRFNTGLCETS